MTTKQTSRTRNADTKTLLKRHIKELEQSNKLMKELLNKLNIIAENSPITSEKKKKIKDPNKPKKNKNGYMFYCQEKRADVKAEHPGIDGKDLVKHLSKKWNTMSDNEKAPYQLKASQDKERYKKEMEVYNKQQ